MTCQSSDGALSAAEFTWISVLKHFLEYDRNFHHHSLDSDIPCGCLSTPSMAMQALFKTFAVMTVLMIILTFLKLFIPPFRVPFSLFSVVVALLV